MIIAAKELHTYEFGLGYDIEELKSMPIGMALPIKETLNKIKRISEDEWIFQRFDSIKTHLVRYESSSEDTQKIWNNFKEACDYSLKYAQDRCNAVKNNFDEETATRIISSYKFMNEQLKTTASPLSGETGFTKTLEKMTDYIVFAKFDNIEQEIEYEENKKQIQRLEKIKKKKRKEQEEIRMAELKKEVKDTPYSKTKKLLHAPKHFKMQSVDKAIEEQNGLHASDNANINYTKIDRQLQQGKFDESMEAFWDRFSPSKRNDIPHYHKEPLVYKDVAHETMLQYITEIKHLEELPFSPDRAKQISNLKSEMRTALDVLRKVITVQPSLNIHETIPNDSWDRLSLRDTDTYVALLFGYNEACKKYDSKVSTTYWALLRDFEDLLQKTEWSKEEAVIIEYILETGITEHKGIQEELLEVLCYEISAPTLSKWLNNLIPNKLLDTYEQQLEDWIWIDRRKGLYKTCSKCGESKLAVDSRNFRADKTGRLGLRSVCKSCMNM